MTIYLRLLLRLLQLDNTFYKGRDFGLTYSLPFPQDLAQAWAVEKQEAEEERAQQVEAERKSGREAGPFPTSRSTPATFSALLSELAPV